MSEEGRDIKAAEKEFAELLKLDEKEIEKQQIVKETKSFLQGFLGSYHEVKIWTGNGKSGSSLFHLRNFTTQGRNALFFALHPNNEEAKKLENFRLGQSLGFLLGVVEFGIASPNYGKIHHPWTHPESLGDPRQVNLEEDSKILTEILARMQEMAKMLKEQGKNVRISFLKRRVLKIGKSKTLSAEQKEIIVKIAAIFA